jgi:antitoxin MazE
MIPKPEAKLPDEENQPNQHPRQNWEEQFRVMAERGDDKLLEITEADLTEWDSEEWEW